MVGWLWKTRTRSHSSIFTSLFETGRIRISMITAVLVETSFLTSASRFVILNISVSFHKFFDNALDA